MQRRRFLVTALVLTAGLVEFQPLAFADLGTLTLTGTPAGSLAGVYTSPYAFTFVDNTTGTQLNPSSSTQILTGYLLSCDTFDKEIWFNETWPVITTPLSNAGNGTEFTATSYVYLPDGTEINGKEYTARQQYDAAAYLIDWLMSDFPNPSLVGQAEDLSYAIWQIFDASAAGGLSSGDQAAVATEMKQAFSNLSVGASLNVTIYTAYPNVAPYGYSSAPQEFLGMSTGNVEQIESVVPEAPAPTFLAFDLLALYSIALLGRRGLRTTR